jgi:hypothetical protein
MRRFSLLAALLSGCLHSHSYIGVDGAALGRVVVYRNGVAFYQREAQIRDGKLSVHVPRDRVDDFLKSLTVVDKATNQPLSLSIPRKEADDGSYLTMVIETPDRKDADVQMTYVTEAAAWKPSYRVAVGNQGKVMLEGWAVVDNVSGEDWKGVKVGVGASSALSFRYDLWSVHRIDRDLLAGEEKFAIAPPTGVSPYAEATATEELGSLDPSEVRGDVDVAGKQTPAESLSGSMPSENSFVVDGANIDAGEITGVVTDARSGEKLPGVTVIVTSPSLSGTQTAITDDSGVYRLAQLPPGKYQVAFYYADVTLERSGIKLDKGKVAMVSQKIDQSRSGGEVIRVTGSVPTIDPTSTTQGVTITKDYLKNIPPGRTFDEALGSAPGSQGDSAGAHFDRSTAPPPPPPVKVGDEKLHGIASKVVQSKRDVVIEAHAGTIADARKRAEAVANKLIDEGVPAAKIHVTPQVGGEEIRVLAVAPGATPASAAPPTAHTQMPDTPVGESHFMADHPMNVRAGSSAMVAMLHKETTGGVVYLYDPISERGNGRYAFKAVRLDNPTDDTLEPGPVTVYGDERFIGEGITESVPPRASVVVPFALDREVVVEHMDNENDKIDKLVTAQRGILTAEVKHRKSTRFTITSRLHQPTTVYLRHKLSEGYALVDAPSKFMKVGDSQLFEVDLKPGETKYVTIAETTPVQRSLELASPDAIGMLQIYVDSAEASPAFKAQLEAILATHKAGVDLDDKIATLRDQLVEYRERQGELHGQLVTLKMVKTSGPLMASLRQKLMEVSDAIQKATVAIVDAQEQIMLTRVKFENQIAELHLDEPKMPLARDR